jgi:hypothetical protein
MGRFICFLVAFTFLFGLALAYLPGTEDVPLMRGLELVEDPIIFDKLEGRLVTLHAQGDVSEKDISEFYAATLPNLGWKKKADSIYMREGESLKLSFKNFKNKKILVTFEIAPISPAYL